MTPFQFSTVQELVEKASYEGTTISQIVAQWEVETSNLSREKIFEKMSNNWKVMKKSIEEGLQKEGQTMGGLVNKAAAHMYNAISTGIVPQDRLSKTIYKALAVAEFNASMGCIVAAPTGGSCGIIPAVLSTAQEEYNFNDEQIVWSLFTAAGIGLVIAEKASVSGAEGGCQAECGSAAAMAAAALVELLGGPPQKVATAAALALKNALGLVCDPVGGLVEVPCIKRNSFLAVNSLVAADLAMAGIPSLIPIDEVITAMGEIGRALPESLRERAQGGLAATPTGKKYKNE